MWDSALKFCFLTITQIQNCIKFLVRKPVFLSCIKLKKPCLSVMTSTEKQIVICFFGNSLPASAVSTSTIFLTESRSSDPESFKLFVTVYLTKMVSYSRF